MENRLVSLEVENFRSLRKITLPLGPVTVLVGPNGAGKTNVMKVLEFLDDIVRVDLAAALETDGGFDEIAFRGGEEGPHSIRIKASFAEDAYELKLTKTGEELRRFESFSFGTSSRLTVSDQGTVAATGIALEGPMIGINADNSGLSTLPRLRNEAGRKVGTIASRLRSLRVFDVEVRAARRPTPHTRRSETLADDAGNLAAYLFSLRQNHEADWLQLVEDARFALPQLQAIDFIEPSENLREVSIILVEKGMRRPTSLLDASFGTVRMLGLLALLHDPYPPALTCIEEIENGLHPQALEMLVDRIREASERTQFLIATHSPALVDRLYPDEFVICERHEDGSSTIPAIPTEKVRRIVATSEDLPLGELWFSGVLGGDL
jgi:predicted ATPase